MGTPSNQLPLIIRFSGIWCFQGKCRVRSACIIDWMLKIIGRNEISCLDSCVRARASRLRASRRVDFCGTRPPALGCLCVVVSWGFVPAELRHAGFWDAGVCVPVALPPPLCLPQCNIIIFIFQNGTILIWLLSNVDCRLGDWCFSVGESRNSIK